MTLPKARTRIFICLFIFIKTISIYKLYITLLLYVITIVGTDRWSMTTTIVIFKSEISLVIKVKSKHLNTIILYGFFFIIMNKGFDVYSH